MAAREIGTVGLSDALALALLIAEQAPTRWPRAAARWHARFVLAAKGIEVENSALALQLVNALGGKDVESAWQMLRLLAGRYGLTL